VSFQWSWHKGRRGEKERLVFVVELKQMGAKSSKKGNNIRRERYEKKGEAVGNSKTERNIEKEKNVRGVKRSSPAEGGKLTT